MIRLWRNAWTEFVPFLDYDLEIRKVICSTNAIGNWIGAVVDLSVSSVVWGSLMVHARRFAAAVV
jgi:mutator family transposase